MKVYIVYFSNLLDGSGVNRKMNSFAKAFVNNGLNVETMILTPGFKNTIKSWRNLASLMVNSSAEDFILVRYNNTKNLFLTSFALYCKMKKVRLVFDIPTPIAHFAQEMRVSGEPYAKRLILNLWTRWLKSKPFELADLNIQYAPESATFVGRSKQLLVGNSIDIDDLIDYVDLSKRRNKDCFNMVFVANFAVWHGLELLLKTLPCLRFNFHLDIIGEGKILENCKKMVLENELAEKVTFHGFLTIDSYSEIFNEAHLGIGTLNWGVVGVKYSSVLKLREYALFGLPVVYSSYDPDFNELPFAYNINSDEVSLASALELAYSNRLTHSYHDVSQYAVKNLNFTVRVQKVLRELID